MSYSIWNIKNQDIKTVNMLANSLNCSELLARLLVNRGITDPDYAKEFLFGSPNFDHDPFLLCDTGAAAKRIIAAIDNKEKICIYGDYDVDGITSVSVMYTYLKNFTDNVQYYIPDRFSESYGVNKNAVSKIKENGCTLIITVDTGISAIDEVTFGKEIGVDFVITDHHECQQALPNACAVVNPKRSDSTYPFEYLAGVGVAYKLVSALDGILGANHRDDCIDLVAIGTVADIMPLVDENRSIVARGIKKLETSPNNGIRHLLNLCMGSTKASSTNIGYMIAPRINAAGRMEKAVTAVELLVSCDDSKVSEIANHLCELNSKRQNVELQIYNDAVRIINEHDLDRRFSVLVIWEKGWHSGVVGIVASKLKERYNKPIVLLSVEENAKGSARSLPPFNIFAAFDGLKDMLIQYGGHEYAAGVLVSPERLFEFRDRLCEYYNKHCASAETAESIDVECIISAKALNVKMVNEIDRLQPFGKLNSVPIFAIKNVIVDSVFPTSNNKHIRLKLNIDGKIVTGFYFGVSPDMFDYRAGHMVDLLCELNENEYRGIKSVQLIIHDIRLTENQLQCIHNKRTQCDNASIAFSSVLPSKNEIGVVYKYFLSALKSGKHKFNIDNIAGIVDHDCAVSLSYEKVYYSLRILMELGLINGSIDSEILNISNVLSGIKVSLSDSAIYKNLCETAGEIYDN